MTTYTVTAHDNSDFTYTFTIEATSAKQAIELAKQQNPWSYPYDAKLKKTSLLYVVTGLVDGVKTTQKLWASGVTEQDRISDAGKFFKKLTGAYKRKGKKTVEVLSVVEVSE